jgi:hypothetical protein
LSPLLRAQGPKLVHLDSGEKKSRRLRSIDKHPEARKRGAEGELIKHFDERYDNLKLANQLYKTAEKGGRKRHFQTQQLHTDNSFAI